MKISTIVKMGLIGVLVGSVYEAGVKEGLEESRNKNEEKTK